MASKLPTVAIIGQANVGKSSLFNRMVRAQQAIVAREAGTTRDNVLGKVEFHGKQFWLVDTAGLKDPNDEFEASIQEQITEAADAADVILVVVDSPQYVSDDDRFVAKKALKSKKPVILVTNKADLKGALPDDEFRRLGVKTIIRTSAEHNSGVVDVLNEIVDIIPKASETEDDDTLRIALIGRPNVGKSHLFNTLAGKQQAIVANIAGTTRDVNRVSMKYHGRSIEILDTAGIRRQGPGQGRLPRPHGLERQGRHQQRQADPGRPQLHQPRRPGGRGQRRGAPVQSGAPDRRARTGGDRRQADRRRAPDLGPRRVRAHA